MNSNKVAWICLVISVIVLISLITINFVLYAGVVSLGTYFPFIIIMQVLFYKIRNYTIGLLILNTTIILTFLVVYLSIFPSFDYEEGKNLIEKEVGQDNLNFLEVDYKTVPTTDNNQFLYRNLNYYYKIAHLSSEQFFSVDPITGKVFKLNRPFY
ncbi:hypothetical protein IMZ08_18005 [Bacillus luteolus]|uniref:Uncharacterized protein n=2 Tax=Litchfieldia luteola TaxID=682179 RepID=A0ABR9QN48_9BACI|nr:hypothetical protein [Cytobacillus luteolus]MBE4909933.1 hypothetical protein [Cytobacillus luteolus]MBP1942511.1 hypothetical protein [Cytobacillus luteolus]